MSIHKFKIEAIDEDGISTQIVTESIDLQYDEDIELAMKYFVKLLIKCGAELPEEITDMIND